MRSALRDPRLEQRVLFPNSGPRPSSEEEEKEWKGAAPEWVTKPRDTSSALNGPASLDCLAVGYPTPTVRWSREETVSDDVELRPVPLGGARVSLLANGTLVIREVRKEDAGQVPLRRLQRTGTGPGRHAHALASRARPLRAEV
ncbi:hypothetical protein MTO96_049578 [Rhipicephalus appendiculatus]